MYLLMFLEKSASLSVGEMVVRGGVIFWTCYGLLRIGRLKIFGKKSAMDYVIIIVMGSVLAKVVIGDAGYVPATAACLMMVGFNRLVSMLCATSTRIDRMIEGAPTLLVKDGQVYWQRLKASSISYQDLLQSLRLEMHTEDFSGIAEALLESSGRISFVAKEKIAQ